MAAALALMAITLASFIYGFGWLVLGLWVGVPLWLLISAYKKERP